jgi:hypothetical protein
MLRVGEAFCVQYWVGRRVCVLGRASWNSEGQSGRDEKDYLDQNIQLHVLTSDTLHIFHNIISGIV